MKYYTNEKGEYVAETDSGFKATRCEVLPEDYYVYYDYLYFCGDEVVRSDICGTITQFRNDLITQNKAKPDSKIYSLRFF